MKTRILALIFILSSIAFAQQPVTVANFPNPQTVSNSALTNLQFDGSNNLKVILQNATVAVTGTFWQSVQPISSTQLPAALDGSGFLKTHEQGTASVSFSQYTPASGRLPVDGSGVTQPVSIAANVATTDAGTSATGSAVPAKAGFVGGSDGTNLVGYYIDPCQRGARIRVAISLTANTKIITGTSLKKTYVCDLDIVAAAATNVALVEGTGSTCGTGTAGMAGGATAATGWNFAANGGLVKGVGGFAVYSAATNADDVCLFVSAANQISGSLSYVQF